VTIDPPRSVEEKKFIDIEGVAIRAEGKGEVTAEQGAT